MKNKKITFTIAIPTYNSEKHIKKAIESALNQKYSHFEVIITDNCSTDKTKTICKQYTHLKNFKFYENKKNIGATLNIRQCMLKSKGDFFLVLPSDDYFIDESYLEKVAQTINKYEDIVLVHANYKIYYEKNNTFINKNLMDVPFFKGTDYFFEVQNTDDILPAICTTFYNRKIAKQLNIFSNTSIIATDIEATIKMSLKGNIAFIRTYATVYNLRLNSHNNTSTLDICIQNAKLFDNLYIEAKPFFPKSKLDKWKRKILLRYSEGIITKAIYIKDRRVLLNTLKTIHNKFKIPYYFIFYRTTPIRLLLAFISFKLYFGIKNTATNTYLFLNKRRN